MGIKFKEYGVLTMINSFDSRSYIFAYHKSGSLMYGSMLDIGSAVLPVTQKMKIVSSILNEIKVNKSTTKKAYL